MQTESTKLIFIMNFSVLHFFKFASRMPQISNFGLCLHDMEIIPNRGYEASLGGEVQTLPVQSASSWRARQTWGCCLVVDSLSC